MASTSSLHSPVEALKAVSYNSTVAAEPPVSITTATSPTPSGTPSINGRPSLNAPSVTQTMKSRSRRPSVATASAGPDDSASVNSANAASPTSHTGSLRSAASLPQIRVDQHAGAHKKGDKWWKQKKAEEAIPESTPLFQKIELDIPTGGLDDLATENITFSNRGSVLMGPLKKKDNVTGHLRPAPSTTRRIKSNPSLRHKAVQAQHKLMSVDEELLSQKVRSYYEVGSDAPVEGDDQSSTVSHTNGTIWEDSTVAPDASATSVSRQTSQSDIRSITSSRTHQTRSRSGSAIKREKFELAGGYEDWQDVRNADVDRYGFIITRSPSQGAKSAIQRSPSTMEGHSLQRVSTSLQLAAESPRRKRTVKKQNSSVKGGGGSARGTSTNGRPGSSQSSIHSTNAANQSLFRTATNRLPHNKGRRLKDEAGDMLTLPPGLSRSMGDEVVFTESPQVKRIEWSREEKWKKMAHAQAKDNKGGGMIFEFDMHNPKLIERTWKGIPDKWRGSAWYSFLSESARKKNSTGDHELIQLFGEYQDQSSPEDVQIDIDVPRTVGAHIMFRRRYRGGQRLLFRVLHAMSLHFPDTGYVQGMATLAATLLAYYDEEHSFVMMVRLWELRGLEKLYKHGFAGLMEALDDFEKGWLGNGEISIKLVRMIFIFPHNVRWGIQP